LKDIILPTSSDTLGLQPVQFTPSAVSASLFRLPLFATASGTAAPAESPDAAVAVAIAD